MRLRFTGLYAIDVDEIVDRLLNGCLAAQRRAADQAVQRLLVVARLGLLQNGGDLLLIIDPVLIKDL